MASGQVLPIWMSISAFLGNVIAEQPTCINGAIQRARAMRTPTVEQPRRYVTFPTSVDNVYSLFLTP